MPRAMYVAHARATEELRRIEEDPARLLSPALNLALSLPIALLIGVPTAGVGAGVLLGALFSVVVYLLMRRRARAEARKVEQVIAEARAVGISARSIDSRPDQATALVVTVSERVASAINRGDPRFSLEALVNEQWRRTIIRQMPTERREVVSDKRGRVYGSSADATPRLAFSIAES